MLTKLLVGATAVAVAQPILASSAVAQSAPASTAPALQGPRAQPLPYDENYSDLADPAKRTTLHSKFKYIPVADGTYLTLGGESRTRYEYRNNERFGGGAQDDDGNLEQRTRLWGDLHIGQNLRLFGELRSGVQSGFTGTQIVSDRKDVDLAQAFVEISGPAAGGKLSLRLGRQEIGIGGFKLFDMREGPNVRRSFDVARLRYSSGPWDGELLGGYAIGETFTAFDNYTRYDSPFYGVRLARDLAAVLPGAKLETLWVHTKRPVARYDAGAAAEQRDTFSLRFSGKNGRAEWDVETVGQTGSWGNQQVRAGFVTAHATYGLKGAWSPRLGMRFEIASGDKTRNDGKMNTYYHLFARPLTVTGELGRANLTALGPTLTLTPSKKLTIDTTVTSLWRTNLNDGLYTASGTLFRTANAGTDRHVGVRGTLAARYVVTPLLTVGAYYNHIERGSYLKQIEGTGNLDYANFYFTVRF